MAKQHGQGQAGQAGPATRTLTPVVDALDGQARDAEVEALARDLYVRVMTTGLAVGRTPNGVARDCFAKAAEFYAARDARRAGGSAGA